jgi:hypothetical protein
VSAKLVPCLLSRAEEFRLLISKLHEGENSDLVFLRRLITGDESWRYGYDLETKMQFSLGKTELAMSKESTSIEINCESHMGRFNRY